MDYIECPECDTLNMVEVTESGIVDGDAYWGGECDEHGAVSLNIPLNDW